MDLCLLGNNFRYETEKLIRLFFPFEKIVFCESLTDAPRRTVTEVAETPQGVRCSVSFRLDGDTVQDSTVLPCGAELSRQERALAVLLYRILARKTGYTPPWGILTGVRPAKLFAKKTAELGEAAAAEYFRDELLVHPQKIDLCRKTTAAESAICACSAPQSFSLYLSVPFCPSRCHYCSFVSHSVDKAEKLIAPYVERLCEELKMTAESAQQAHLRLETVYFGGGTPTTLSAEQLTRVFDTVRSSFDLSTVREYTVEAGRPDTATPERLQAILAGGATRISINPQTMSDSVLQAIGRKHTAQQTEEAFHLARKIGFSNINMDLIAGLPTDTFAGFASTLRQVTALCPESITVHALSMKRASTLTADGRLPETEMGQVTCRMVDHANAVLSAGGWLPYYMYRQSKTVGNLENVGYAKPGFEGLYNVYIMDETHTILACGASAVTKLREPFGDGISRIFNYKYPYEYLSRFEEMTARKKGITEFYARHPVERKDSV